FFSLNLELVNNHGFDLTTTNLILLFPYKIYLKFYGFAERCAGLLRTSVDSPCIPALQGQGFTALSDNKLTEIVPSDAIDESDRFP
ncbi:MAG: hypothetical protein AB1861_28900, partial [Cyanobacteriota bacterium]